MDLVYLVRLKLRSETYVYKIGFASTRNALNFAEKRTFITKLGEIDTNYKTDMTYDPENLRVAKLKTCPHGGAHSRESDFKMMIKTDYPHLIYPDDHRTELYVYDPDFPQLFDDLFDRFEGDSFAEQ